MNPRMIPLSAVLVAFLSIAVYLTYQYEPNYIFTPEAMLDIAQTAIKEGEQSGGLNTTVTSVIRQLKERYPEHILENPPWMFNNAGGAMGAMLVLHCSFIEYVIVFGTPLGTEGHTNLASLWPTTISSGRFWADDFLTILHGEQWAFPAGALEREVYRPGDMHILPRGTSKQYKMPDSGCWALEYARGNIASMLPFGLADSFSSTFDLVTVWQTVKVSATGMFRELLMNNK